MRQYFQKHGASLSTALIRQRLFFPDRRLVQFDCGKLQVQAMTHLSSIWSWLAL